MEFIDVPISHLIFTRQMERMIKSRVNYSGDLGVIVVDGNDLPMSDYRLDCLMEIRYLPIDIKPDGTYIYGTKKEEIPPIDIRYFGNNKYQVINGRHRVVMAMLLFQPTIRARLH